MDRECQEANLDRMLVLPMCAVMCRTEDELKSFYHNCRAQLGALFQWDFGQIHSLWTHYGYGETGFTMFVNNNRENHMSWCSEQWFRNNRYEIVEFSELANVNEIEESEQSIEFLIG